MTERAEKALKRASTIIALSLTVDEMSQRYVRYVGDDNEIAISCLDGKAEAKTYIRSLFGETV